jgi:hypothetical protein
LPDDGISLNKLPMPYPLLRGEGGAGDPVEVPPRHVVAPAADH